MYIVIAFGVLLSNDVRNEWDVNEGRFNVRKRRDFNRFTICFIVMIFIVCVNVCFFRHFGVFVGHFFVFVFSYFFRLIRGRVEDTRFCASLGSFARANMIVGGEVALFSNNVGFTSCFFVVDITFNFDGYYRLNFLFYFYFRCLVISGNFVRTSEIFPVITKAYVFTNMLSACFIANDRFFLRCVLARAACTSAKFINKVRPLFRFALD